MLLPGLPRIWRGTNTLQLGLHPARAILLDLPDPATAKILDLLDGTRPERAILRAATTLDISPAEVRTLLDVLHKAGLVISAQSLYPPALDTATRRLLSSEAVALALAAQVTQPATPRDEEANPTPDGEPEPEPEPEVNAESARETGPRRNATTGGRPASPAAVLRRRRSARVVVTGRGRLGAGIAVGLAEAGVGLVQVELPGSVSQVERIGGPLRDVGIGSDRTAAVNDAIRRVAPAAEARTVRRGRATLVVQLCHDEPVALLAFAHLQRQQPYLAVSVREGAAVIGPLVPADGRPCLNCLAMFRQPRAWEEETAAASGPGFSELTTSGEEPLAVATVLAACGYAVAEVLNFVDGAGTETLGAEVEVSAPGQMRRRRWLAHPYCTCSQPRRRPVPADR
jgi:hypothetical protein